MYLKSVSGLSCRSRDWRRYLHPLSAGVPGHDETRSVKSQSDVSDSLRRMSEVKAVISAIKVIRDTVWVSG